MIVDAALGCCRIAADRSILLSPSAQPDRPASRVPDQLSSGLVGRKCGKFRRKQARHGGAASKPAGGRAGSAAPSRIIDGEGPLTTKAQRIDHAARSTAEIESFVDRSVTVQRQATWRVSPADFHLPRTLTVLNTGGLCVQARLVCRRTGNNALPAVLPRDGSMM